MMPAATTPDEGVLVGVPVRRRRGHGLLDLGPRLEAAAFERQGAQDLPPGLDQIQVGGVLGLEDELPTRVRQREQQHVGGAVSVLARDISDAVQVGGLETVAAALVLDPETGLILGSGVAADPAAALKDLLANVAAGPSTTRAGPPRLLCRPELVSIVAGCLPAAWHL